MSEPARHDAPVTARRLRDASRPFLVGLGLIALLALGVRLFWVLVAYDNFRPSPDAVYYHVQGWAIADGHWFIDPAQYYYPFTGQPIRVVQPGATHPPLYGLYLGLVSWLGFWSVKAHRLASCLLGTGAVVVIALTGRKMVSERVGLLAAAVAAVYANLWINDGILVSESLTALTTALVLLAAYALWRRATLANAAWLGLAFGLATLSRAEIVILAPLLAFPLVLGMRDVGMRSRFQMLSVIALCMAALVGPWVGYNLTRFEKPVLLTSNPSTVLAFASCDATYYGKLVGWYSACPALTPRLGRDDAPTHRPGRSDASQYDAIQRHAALRYIRHHLGRMPVVMLIRVGRLWDVYRPAQTRLLNATQEFRTRGASRVAQISSWLLFPVAIAGLIVMRRWRVPISPLVAPAVVVTIVAAIFFGVLRYRVSAEPSLVLAAAVSLDVLWTSMIDRRRARVPEEIACGPAT